MAEVGYRVIRAPNWPLQDEDGGDGGVGTVVEVGGKGKSSLPKNLVIVQWDIGNRLEHRAGYYGDYDLYVVDTAAAGVRHDGMKCSGCSQKPIYGMRWHCLNCINAFNLCTSCYMSDEHEKNHCFERIDKHGMSGVNVGKRFGEENIQVRGIFSGAKVIRGHDWRWEDQDGGAKLGGFVLETADWRPEYRRSAATVSWTHADKDAYRVGYKGKVDLMCVIPGILGFVYKTHLPLLGWKASNNVKIGKTEKTHKKENAREVSKMKKERKNNVIPTEEGYKKQEKKNKGKKPGKPAPKKTKDLKHSKTSKEDSNTSSGGDERSKNILHAEERQQTKSRQETNAARELAIGDPVRIMANVENLHKLQIGHGHCQIELISKCAGQLGKVSEIDEDGDVEVTMEILGDSKRIIFNPAALQLDNTTGTATAKDGGTKIAGNSNGKRENEFVQPRTAPPDPVLNVKQPPKEDTRITEELKTTFVGSAGQGLLAVVERTLELHPDMLECKANGQTALHQACHSGRTEVVDFLLKRGASVTIQDDQEFTALHHACYGDNSGNTAGLVIFSGADLNDNRNITCSTPLHLAVMECNVNAVYVVIQGGGDPNLQDMKGNTALHIAVMKGFFDIVDAILSSPKVNLSLRDMDGSNPIVQAICRRFIPVARKMIEHSPHVVNDADEKGNTILHYAAVYDDQELTECILSQESCNVNIRNKNGQIALELAVAAESSVAEALIRRHCRGEASQASAAVEPAADHEATPALETGTSRIQHKNHEYREEETVRARDSMTVVAALQHYHGGWNDMMKAVLGQLGRVLKIDNRGDVHVSFNESGLMFCFNPLALCPFTSDESSSSAFGEPERSDKRQDKPNHKFGPSLRMPGFSPQDIDQSLSNRNLGRALFLSIGMRMVWRVRDILEKECEVANHSEDSVPVLHQACQEGSVEIIDALLEAGAEVNTKLNGSTALHDAAIYDETGVSIPLFLQEGRFSNPDVKHSVNEWTALHVAVIRGNVATVKALIEQESDVTVKDLQGNTAFHYAAANEREDIMGALVGAQDVNLSNMFNSKGYNVIHIASCSGNVKIVRQLLQREPELANLPSTENLKQTPLHLACSHGDLPVVNELLETGNCDLPTKDENGDTALDFALRGDWKLVVRRLIDDYEKRGADDEPEETFSQIELPQFKKDDIVRVCASEEVLRIIQKGCGTFNENLLQALNKRGQVLSVDDNGNVEVLVETQPWTFHPCALALVSSSEKETGMEDEREAKTEKTGQVSQVKAFRASSLLGGNLQPDSMEGLSEAVSMNNVPRLKEILERDPQKVMAQRFDGNTALHVACTNRSVDVIHFLLEKKANPMAVNSNGVTPLHFAAACDLSGNIVATLLDSGADPNTVMSKSSRMTCLHTSILRGKESVAEVLIGRGADVNAQDDEGDAPLNYAVKQRNDKMVAIIVECPGHDPLVTDLRGFTALHLAAEYGNEIAAKKLIQRYGDHQTFIDKTNNCGSTALLLAAQNNKIEVVRTLLETGKCDVNKKNGSNQTPLDVAVLNNHQEVIHLLHDYGAVGSEGSSTDHPISTDKTASNIEKPHIQQYSEQPEPYRQSDEGKAAKEPLVPKADSAKTEQEAEKAGSSVDDGRNCHTTEEENTISELPTVEEPSNCASNEKNTANNTDNETDSTEKLRRQHSRQECVVCWDNKRDVKFQPCGHVVCCVNCGINVAKCPYCREKIAGRMVTRVRNMPDDK